MSKRFNALVFDWDGTLANSTALIVHAIQHAFAEVGLAAPSDEEANFVIGYGLNDAMRHLAPHVQLEQVHGIVDAYKHYYLARENEIVLFDGVVDTLARYKQEGYLLAVATGKSRKGLDRALQQTGLDVIFDVTRCADECHSKPHPQMLLEILDYFGLPATHGVMVGDTTHDLNMAENAKMAGIGVSYGAHPRHELAALAPLAICDSFMEFDAWVQAYG